MPHLTIISPASLGYYLHSAYDRAEGGEGAGRWWGAGAAALGLHGAVERDAMEELFRTDRAGGRIAPPTPRRRRNAGFDLTFSAPKAASVLAGLAPADVGHALERAHEGAAAAAVGYLERHAVWVRRPGGHVAARGMVGAAFGHRTSRSQDPHLHTHVLVPNRAWGPDGGWSALALGGLFPHLAAAQALYQADLRWRLSQQLGLRAVRVGRGLAGIEGVPPTVVAAFSRRRAQVEAALEQRGAWSGRAASIAAVATRPRKSLDNAATEAERRSEWRERAARLGFGEEQVAAARAQPPPPRPDPADLDRISRQLLGPAGVTASFSTFSRCDVLVAWAARLPQGLPVAEIEALADAWLVRSEIAQDRSGRIRASTLAYARASRPMAEPRFTTRAVQQLESGLEAAAETRTSGWPSATAAAAEAAVRARPSLGPVAAQTMQTATSGRGVVMVDRAQLRDGPVVLDALREAWESSGLRVAAVGADARGQAEREVLSGIAPARAPLAPRSILVIGEADRMGSRQLAGWIDLAGQAGATAVVMEATGPRRGQTGDRSGGWRALRSGLERGRERTQEGERERVPVGPSEPVQGRAAPGEPAPERAAPGRRAEVRRVARPGGSVVIAGSVDEQRAQLVEDWHRARRAERDVVMVTARRREAGLLNQEVRGLLAREGVLWGPEVLLGGQPWQAGDLSFVRRGHLGAGLRTGERLAMDRVGPDGLTASDGRTIPAAHVAAANLVHAYALTIYDSHYLPAGATLLVAGDDRLLELAGGRALVGRARDIHRYVIEARSRTREDPVREPAAELHDRLVAGRAAPARGLAAAVGRALDGPERARAARSVADDGVGYELGG